MNPRAPKPAVVMPHSGVIEAGQHYFPLRVYYEDTDAGGIVYHANYLKFAERARSEFLRLIGWEHERLARDAGLTWVVHRIDIFFRQSARLDEALVVETRLDALRAASVQVVQKICRDGDELARLTVELVLLSASGRPGRAPPALRSALVPLLVADESKIDPCLPLSSTL